MMLFKCIFCGKPIYDTTPNVTWYIDQYVHAECLEESESKTTENEDHSQEH